MWQKKYQASVGDFSSEIGLSNVGVYSHHHQGVRSLPFPYCMNGWLSLTIFPSFSLNSFLELDKLSVGFLPVLSRPFEVPMMDILDLDVSHLRRGYNE